MPLFSHQRDVANGKELFFVSGHVEIATCSLPSQVIEYILPVSTILTIPLNVLSPGRKIYGLCRVPWKAVWVAQSNGRLF